MVNKNLHHCVSRLYRTAFFYGYVFELRCIMPEHNGGGNRGNDIIDPLAALGAFSV